MHAPETAARLTPIQSAVLSFATAQAKQNQSRLNLQQFERAFQDHKQATAVPEAIYELLEAGFLAEYRDKKGHVVAKNYVVTDAGKDQAAYEETIKNTPRERISRAARGSTADAKDAWDGDQEDQAEDAAKSANKPSARKKVASRGAKKAPTTTAPSKDATPEP